MLEKMASFKDLLDDILLEYWLMNSRAIHTDGVSLWFCLTGKTEGWDYNSARHLDYWQKARIRLGLLICHPWVTLWFCFSINIMMTAFISFVSSPLTDNFLSTFKPDSDLGNCSNGDSLCSSPEHVCFFLNLLRLVLLYSLVLEQVLLILCACGV